MRQLIKEALRKEVINYIKKKYIGLQTKEGTVVDVVDDVANPPQPFDFVNGSLIRSHDNYLEVQLDKNWGTDCPNIWEVCSDIKKYFGIRWMRYRYIDSKRGGVTEWF